MEPLTSRREKAALNFATKACKNPIYADLFPVNQAEARTRDHKHYQEVTARTDRLYNSPVYYMRRLLNNTPHSDRNNNPNVTDLAQLFNDPYG